MAEREETGVATAQRHGFTSDKQRKAVMAILEGKGLLTRSYLARSRNLRRGVRGGQRGAYMKVKYYPAEKRFLRELVTVPYAAMKRHLKGKR